jgi:hypothetical protein
LSGPQLSQVLAELARLVALYLPQQHGTGLACCERGLNVLVELLLRLPQEHLDRTRQHFQPGLQVALIPASSRRLVSLHGPPPHSLIAAADLIA